MRTNDVAHVLVFGEGRPLNGLLVSPKTTYSDRAEFLRNIWPAVAHMNKIVPTHSRVVRDLIIIEDPLTPFALTDKGTVKAKATLNLYSEKITKVYENLSSSISDVSTPSDTDHSAVMSYLDRLLRSYTPDAKLDHDTDLFEQGNTWCSKG